MDDKAVLRELVRRYGDVFADPDQERRRDDWRRHNALTRTKTLIYARAFAFDEMEESKCLCVDPLLRQIERQLRYNLFWATLGDDAIFEPWLTVEAVHRCRGWGVAISRHRTADAGGSFKVDYPLRDLADLVKLRPPMHEIDEAATAANAGRVRDAMGDLIEVNVDRSPAYRMWSGDLSTDLGYLRGIENFMMDMMDDPEGLHRLAKFMSEGVLRTHEQAEHAGDWGLSSHQNQAMPYAQELPDPAANTNGVKREQLWCYMAAQEFTAVSPAMHDEFLLRYQLPIQKHFGLVAYGCCEDLTHKIDMLRQIPNLRRIAVSPFADVARCAEQIGDQYVLSYRPSPADMVSYGYDEDRIRRIIVRDLEICRSHGCHVDITLKDVETVQRDPARVRKWVRLVRRILEELGM